MKANDTLDHLRSAGIDAEVFQGFDSEICGLQTVWTYELDHPGSGYRIGPLSVSNILGHIFIWMLLDYSDIDSCLVMEDDVRFIPDWKDHWDFSKSAIPNDWDLIYIGSCCATNRSAKQISGRLHKTDYSLCTHAYAVRKKAARIMIEACEKIYAPIDIAMAIHAIPKLNTYIFLPRLANQHSTVIPP